MARLKVLVIGASGSVGPLVGSPAVAIGDVAKLERLSDALKDVEAMVLPMNATGKAAVEAVYDRGVQNLVLTIGSLTVRIALMTTIGVTERPVHYNRTNEGHGWKRRAEWLVRRSGLQYTIVRPGWFDYDAAQADIKAG